MATNRNSSKRTTKAVTNSNRKKQNSNKKPAAQSKSRNASASSRTGKRMTDRSTIDVPNISRKKRTSVGSEITLWVMLAFCVIFFLNNAFHIGGVIGGSISYFFFGMFGIVAYLMPFILFFMTAFIIANRGKNRLFGKIVFSILMLVTVSCFCELICNQIDPSKSLSYYYISGGDLRVGGGLTGGLVCRFFYPVLGLIGTWICNIVLFVISVIGLTGYSFLDDLGRKSGSAIGHAKTRKNMKRELQHQQRKNQRLQKQAIMQRKIDEIRTENEDLQAKIREPRRTRVVTGVSTNTTVDDTLPKTEEIHEIVPKRPKRQRRKEQEGLYSSVNESVFKQEIKENQRIVDKDRKSEEQQIETRARKMVDSVHTAKDSTQLGMNFTIERNGSSQKITEKEPAFTAAEHSTEEKLPSMPELVQTGEELIHTLETQAKTTDEVSKGKLKNPYSSKEEQESAVENVAKEIEKTSEEPKREYVFPPIELLNKPSGKSGGDSNDEVTETAKKLQNTLHNFGVNVSITNVSCGPAVTRYELLPEQGVKVSRIVNLSDDIKLNLAAADIRIEAPIPGKAAVGIEVPNKENSAVYLRELLESDEFKSAKSALSFAVGKDIAGKVVVTDIAKMPHLLIAGATGSGKSVCINTLIMSILYKADPEDVKLIMIDPKVVELSVYNGIPHLFIPVVTDPKKASGALNWAVAEMTDRYNKFAETGVRDLKGYNKKIEALGDIEDPDKPKKLPQIVIIVDELADLMMVAPGEVEDAICRLAQLARAAGIHLIIATQRPSVNVITGLIKANMPSRIAFAVTSSVDSRTILDMGGAEKLLGKGDMLFYPQGYPKPVRVQGSFVTDSEVSAVTEFLTQKNDMSMYHKDMEERISKVSKAAVVTSGASSDANELDSNFAEAGKFIIEKDKASIGMLQRSFKIGFNRAARIMDQLADAGVVGPEEGTKPRKVLMSMEEFEQYIDEYV